MTTAKRRAEVLNDETDVVTAAIRRAVRQAIEEHDCAGNSLTIWRDGRMIEVPPEEIPALLAEAYGDDRATLAPPAARDLTPPVPAPER